MKGKCAKNKIKQKIHPPPRFLEVHLKFWGSCDGAPSAAVRSPLASLRSHHGFLCFPPALRRHSG